MPRHRMTVPGIFAWLFDRLYSMTARTVPIRQIAPPIVSSRRGDHVMRFFYSFSLRYGYRPERIPSSQPYIPSPVQRQPSATLPIVIGQSDEP